MNDETQVQPLIDLICEEARGLDDLGKRILANRILEVITEWLPPAKKAESNGLEPMTDEEAKRYGAIGTLHFGMHKGTPIDNVPMPYLLWLVDESRETWRNLHRYLQSPRIKREREAEED